MTRARVSEEHLTCAQPAENLPGPVEAESSRRAAAKITVMNSPPATTGSRETTRPRALRASSRSAPVMPSAQAVRAPRTAGRSVRAKHDAQFEDLASGCQAPVLEKLVLGGDAGQLGTISILGSAAGPE